MTEDLYNPGCGYPYGLGSSQFEEPNEALGHGPGPMQNYSYASPQLLSPSPAFPPSQFSHFSWHDWPSESPANVYQADRSRYRSTSSLSRLPQAGEIHHCGHPSGNQQVSHLFSFLNHYRRIMIWYIVHSQPTGFELRWGRVYPTTLSAHVFRSRPI